jgi:predicted Zn-dependent protease with MMP-like domain
VNEAAFERAVERALMSLPAELSSAIENLAIMIDEENPAEPDLYGLYTGTPLPRRTAAGYAGSLPDTVTIYRRPLIAEFGDDEAELVAQIRVTVLHELGHHFGLSEQDLDRLGWA